MNNLAILRSTVSHPVMNLVLNIAHVAKLKDSDAYRKSQKKASNLRYKAIINGRPYQPVFG